MPSESLQHPQAAAAQPSGTKGKWCRVSSHFWHWTEALSLCPSAAVGPSFGLQGPAGAYRGAVSTAYGLGTLQGGTAAQGGAGAAAVVLSRYTGLLRPSCTFIHSSFKTAVLMTEQSALAISITVLPKYFGSAFECL